MARWIKADGTEETVQPATGVEFTNDELHKMVEGFLTGITLTRPQEGGLYMFMSDTGYVDHKPLNLIATDLLYQHRMDHHRNRTLIYGNVVVTDSTESRPE